MLELAELVDHTSIVEGHLISIQAIIEAMLVCLLTMCFTK